jgi:hypothetical protein
MGQQSDRTLPIHCRNLGNSVRVAEWITPRAYNNAPCFADKSHLRQGIVHVLAIIIQSFSNYL